MKKWIGVALIGIMFLSSIAFAIIQAFPVDQSSQPQEPGQAELPSQLILDYRMPTAQFNEVMSRGFTVATYKYDRDCIECADERSILEQIVLSQEFQNQIILEEIAQDGPSKLEVASAFGTKTLDKIDVNSTLEIFCELVANPPLGCAVKQ